MKRNPKMLMLMLALTMSVSMTACSTNQTGNETNKESGANSGEGSNTAAAETLMKNGKFDPPQTMTVGYNTKVMKFKNGETPENNILHDIFKEEKGIEIKPLWTAATDDAYKNKIQLGVAAGEELPDVLVTADATLINQMIEDGMLTDIGPVFDQYAGANLKKAFEQAGPTVWNSVTKDGKRYGLPIIGSKGQVDPVLWFREDWMKKLNLKAPKTLEDLEVVLDAFVNKDPDGNGKKDTYAISAGTKNNMASWMADLGFVFGAYGTAPWDGMWREGEDGKLMYDAIRPENKQALAKLQEWFKKGYMSPNMGVVDEGKGAEDFTSGKAGLIAGPYWLPDWPLSDLLKNVKGAEFKPYALPTGPDGTLVRMTWAPLFGNYIVSKEMEHPEVFIEYLNYIYDEMVDPAYGGKYEHGIAEGYDYAMVDGKPTSNPEQIPGGKVSIFPEYLLTSNVDMPNRIFDSLTYLNGGKEPRTPKEKTLKQDKPKFIEAGAILNSQKETAVVSQYQGPVTQNMIDKGEAIKTMWITDYTKIIYGKESVDYFDTFVKNWKSKGGDEITADVNEWYSEMKTK
ncbi:hypothetical protein SY83_13545 [Paenibacillus swuensis]|uniref:ABC transporter substrate-binding protein n=1 Tax=Paenibacillus swuensis TaxID=1178515 RepID=A0A172TJ79_9BACL|nr:extracellular solute-binding protein [Paenibacillus swuensis]ANE47115.1 hypothetical protein SY83_13545 [Paenibacillus swuensis]